MATVTGEDRSTTMFYGGYDHQVGRERAVEIRVAVDRNRLESRLAKGAMAHAEDASRRGKGARSGAHFMALFR